MDNINKVLTKGVEQVLPSKDALAKLMTDKKITLYQGFDPTSESLHIGHFIGVRKLAEFQKLGHKVIFLIGDFTAMIGDPTDKTAPRKQLTKEEIQSNLANYKNQASKILKFDGENPAEIKFNSEWLAKMNFEDVINLASKFTVQQMLERDMFKKRLDNNKSIGIHEFLYPLMQGYDSAEMEVDLEIGGNDQLFNMLAGRTLSKTLKNKDKFVLTTKLLTDSSGSKMGKTTGNAISLSDSPNDIFGKVMAFTDDMINLSYELLTDISEDKINSNPMQAKKILAHNLVKQIYDSEKADEALKYFEDTFQNKTPEYDETVNYAPTLIEVVSEITKSNSEAKRLIKNNAVSISGETIADPKYKIKGDEKIKIGKKIFVKVKSI